MRQIDLRSGTLANRAHASSSLEELGAGSLSAGLVLNFNENIATMSWLDGYLTPIVSDATAATVVVLCRLEDTREHIDAILKRRGLAVLAAEGEEQFYSGIFDILGDATAEQRQAFEAVTRIGEASVAEIAEVLVLSIEAAQQRLSDLLAKRLVARKREGRAFVYHVPKMSLEAALA